MLNARWSITQKLDPTLKQSNYKAKERHQTWGTRFVFGPDNRAFILMLSGALRPAKTLHAGNRNNGGPYFLALPKIAGLVMDRRWWAGPGLDWCNGTALRILERPVITWAPVIGIVFLLLGRRIVDGKPEVSGRGFRFSLLRAGKGEKLLSLSLRNQTSE